MCTVSSFYLGKFTVQIRSCFFVFRGGGTRWRGRRRLCLPRLVEVDAGEEEGQAEHDVHSELKREKGKSPLGKCFEKVLGL